jgi:branched-chain amino acid aminotransferase
MSGAAAGASCEGVAWIDGGVVDIGDARIPVTDHGLLYGDGIFEGIRAYRGRVFRLDRHLARFATAARQIALALPGGIEFAREVVFETLRAFACDDAYVRLIATRGVGELGVDPTSCLSPRLVCIAGRVRIYPQEVLRTGIALLTSSLRRPPADVLDPRVKSLNYLNNALAKLEARQRGADEALLLNAAGMVAEASVANVFAVRNGVLLTPPAADGALEGVTRATLLEIAPALEIPAREQTLGRFDLFAADEVFLSGTGAGLVPVRSLDGRTLGAGAPGPVFEKLRVGFADATQRLGVPFAQDAAAGVETASRRDG